RPEERPEGKAHKEEGLGHPGEQPATLVNSFPIGEVVDRQDHSKLRERPGSRSGGLCPGFSVAAVWRPFGGRLLDRYETVVAGGKVRGGSRALPAELGTSRTFSTGAHATAARASTA